MAGVPKKPSSRAQPTESRTPSPFWREHERLEVLEASLLQESNSSHSPASIAHPFLISLGPQAATPDQAKIPCFRSQLGVLANLPPSPSRPCECSSGVCLKVAVTAGQSQEVAVTAVSRPLWSTLPAPHFFSTQAAVDLQPLLPLCSRHFL